MVLFCVQEKAKPTSYLKGDGQGMSSVTHSVNVVFADLFSVIKRNRTLLTTFWPENLGDLAMYESMCHCYVS